ncbi:hypothetical protein RXV94_00090 [Yeosuana sp. MJ-SS3]|jgi:hypothetical protein|uniref:DUF1080 domain-containing protein n=1 Tax=Gilvirhabdus luticola TaxID=3079858 RepID=A0ABU3U2A7_9FLAO|nr:hypothetical protein [Yeosuana sp. MJ-SS3]MDU8884537.1 hypothetical protein [Yeosuana sp. MJ-SS3]
MVIQKKVGFISVLFIISMHSWCQQQINLVDKFQNQKIKAVNRSITLYGDQRDAIELNAENSSGIGIIEDLEFEKGIIEIELLGENNPGKSFIGIAFNIQNNDTYEAVYFRPFNFVAEEQIRKEHMVQYIYHPEFTWRKLRSERTGIFEKGIRIPPDPEDWFKVSIHIKENNIEVYVNDLSEPSLIVDRLSSTKSKKIGVWSGYGSSGRFKNLIIK